MNDFLESIEPLEDELEFNIYAYVDPTTREVDAVWAYSLLGISERNAETETWDTIPADDERVLDTQDFVTYKVDWNNESSFDKETDESLVVSLFDKGELTEDYLKASAIFVKDENGKKPSSTK